MRQLFELIYRFRAFFTFILFEVLSFWLIIGDNQFHNAAFINTSNNVIASIYVVKQNVYKYFNLVGANRDLARENAYLRELIARENRKFQATDTLSWQKLLDFVHPVDTVQQYEFIPAKVLNNSFRLNNNFVTINKGRVHGIRPEMGVISSGGVVGQVKSVSNQYSTIYSLLHSEMYISSILKRLEVFGSTKWEGGSPLKASLLYIPRHVQVEIGDTIVTSGYNAIFPPDIPIGVVEDISINENDTFYNIEIKLSNDFTSLSYVYIINNKFREEKVFLELTDEQD